MKHFTIALAWLALTAGASAHAADVPPGYRKIANHGRLVWLASGTRVAFGAEGRWAVRYLAGRFVCEGATFGTADRSNARCAAPRTWRDGYQTASLDNPAVALAVGDPLAPLVLACVPGLPRGSEITHARVDCGGIEVGTYCDEQAEGQKALFRVGEGGELANVTLTSDAADGVWCTGNCVLRNVRWANVCEDAATMRGGPGTVLRVIGGSAANAADKIFQHDGDRSTIRVEGFTVFGYSGTFARSCGTCAGHTRFLQLLGITFADEPPRVAVAKVRPADGDLALLRGIVMRGWRADRAPVCLATDGQRTLGERWGEGGCDVSRADVRRLGW